MFNKSNFGCDYKNKFFLDFLAISCVVKMALYSFRDVLTFLCIYQSMKLYDAEIISRVDHQFFDSQSKQNVMNGTNLITFYASTMPINAIYVFYWAFF